MTNQQDDIATKKNHTCYPKNWQDLNMQVSKFSQFFICLVF